MKYEVTIRKIEIYCVEVDAGSEEEAIEVADLMVEENPECHHNDSDFEATAYEIDEE